MLVYLAGPLSNRHALQPRGAAARVRCRPGQQQAGRIALRARGGAAPFTQRPADRGGALQLPDLRAHGGGARAAAPGGRTPPPPGYVGVRECVCLSRWSLI